MTTALSEPAIDGLEPAVRSMVGDASDDLVAAASLAISFRRLADAFDAMTDLAHDAPALRTRKD